MGGWVGGGEEQEQPARLPGRVSCKTGAGGEEREAGRGGVSS